VEKQKKHSTEKKITTSHKKREGAEKLDDKNEVEHFFIHPNGYKQYFDAAQIKLLSLASKFRKLRDENRLEKYLHKQRQKTLLKSIIEQRKMSRKAKRLLKN
ncbi:MAG: hypothetical protein MHMPM18_004805, partial [Marteilia pararefringens]